MSSMEFKRSGLIAEHPVDNDGQPDAEWDVSDSFGHRMLYCFAPRGKEKGLAVIQAFFDESGIVPTDRICIIGGFVGSAKQWVEFDRLWTQMPDAEVGFHSKRFFARDYETGARVSPYTDWSEDRASALLDGLIGIVNRINVRPIVAGVDVQAFHQFALNERRLLTGARWKASGKIILSGKPSAPYFVAFQDVVLQALECLKRLDWRVHFVFDEQNAFSPFAFDLYNVFKADHDKWSKRMGSIAFERRNHAPPLQAADLLAHCYYQINPITGATINIRTAPVKTALKAWEIKNYDAHFYSESAMNKILSKEKPTSGQHHDVIL